MMHFAHDYQVYHGRINALYLWHLNHPFNFEREPNWVFSVQFWSVRVISAATQMTCYWLGRLFLGMKAEYAEYTPDDAAPSSQQPDGHKQ